MNQSPEIHPTRPAEQALWLIKATIKRFRLEDQVKAALSATLTPLYGRTLRLVPNRDVIPAVLNARGLTGTGVEVGVAHGEFSELILRTWLGQRLISVDPWVEYPADEYIDVCNTDQESMQQSYEMTQRRLAHFGRRSEIWRMTGEEAAKKLSTNSLDFVYIDARHSYEAVLEDLEAWYPLVKPGGIISGHDYNDGSFAEGLHGVRSAVDTYFAAVGLRVHHTFTDVPSISWLVQKKG